MPHENGLQFIKCIKEQEALQLATDLLINPFTSTEIHAVGGKHISQEVFELKTAIDSVSRGSLTHVRN